jgi:hypothetical protein
MTQPPIYEITRIRARTYPGTTTPAACELSAVLKLPNDNAPYCVYNEAVCARLAHTFHIPVADGVLTVANGGPAFASLKLHAFGERLLDLPYGRRRKAAERYPDGIAALPSMDSGC